MTAPLLVFGWGNASRGDDALGPQAIEHLRERLGAAAEGRIDFLDDYQLQPEHALDLVGRERVLFLDASVACAAPFEISAVRPQRDASFSSHAMSPAALLQVFVEQNVGITQRDVTSAQEFIGRQIAEYEAKLREAETAVAT